MMTNTLTTAQGAFDAATQRRAKFAEDTAAASAKLLEAARYRDDILARLARGEPGGAADVRKSEEAVRSAEIAHQIAAGMLRHAVTACDEAQIEALEAAAEALADRTAALEDEHLKASMALDRAMQTAREFAARVNGLAEDLRAADQAAHDHNQRLDAVAQTNATLAGQHRSAWPLARTRAREWAVRYGIPLRAELVTTALGPMIATPTERDTVLITTAEVVALGARGRPVPAEALAA